LYSVIEELKLDNGLLSKELENNTSYTLIQEEEIALLQSLVEEDSDLDNYMLTNGRGVPNIAYKNKRYFKDKPISIYLNELITRDAYEVLHFKKGLSKSNSVMTRAKSVGNKTAKHLTWTDDAHLIKSGDYYLTPSESLVHKKSDCEDHAFLNASLDSEIGVVYGFLTVGKNRFGHAWNCFVHNNKLYYLETTGNTGKVLLASNAKDYEASFIVTKDSTYQVGEMVNFGTKASPI